MGIQQSREDAEPILWLLRAISHPVFLEARTKLADFSRKKCKLNVTKWELLLILQLNALDVKRVSQFLTGEQDPPSVDVNSLFFLLVLTNQELSFLDKVENVVRFVAFENEMPEPGAAGQGSVTLDELLYIFQIAYQLLNRITDLDLINDPHVKAVDGGGAQKRIGDQDQAGQYGSQAEKTLVEGLFGKPGPQQEEETDTALLLKRIQANPDVRRFFQIFQQGKISDEDRLTLEQVKQADKKALASSKSREYPGKGVPDATSEKRKPEQRSEDKLVAAGAQATPTDLMRGATAENLDSKAENTEEKPPFNAQPSYSQDQGPKDLEQFKQAARVQVNPKHCRNVPYSLNRLQLAEEGQQSAHPEDCVFGNIYPQAKSPLSLIKVSKRILEIRNEQRINSQIYDLNDNLEQLQNNIQHIISKNLHFYAQRQLLPFQRTWFAQRKAAEASPAAVNSKLRTLMIEVEAADDFQNADAALNGVKKELRNTLEEYLQQSLVCLKYEHAVAKAKMMHFLGSSGGSMAASIRGTKRLLEQKKFKLLGQIQTIKSIFTSMMEQNWDLELLQADLLYQNIYHHISCLYKSNIDQNFLINFIGLKNKKRDSKRYIHFLEGAYKQAMKITQNELLNFDPEQVGVPQIFSDLALMLEEKLHMHKFKQHIDIIKQHQHQKIQLISYFTHLGKLKALAAIFQQKDNSQAEQLKEYLEARLKKLSLKLEKVDVELVSQLQKRQSRQQVCQQYYSSLGELSVIKCGVRGLDFHHIFDYLALAMIKQRTQEAIFFHIGHKPSDSQEEQEEFVQAKGTVLAPPVPPSKLSADDYASLIQLQQMKYIDGLLTPGIGDTQSEESFLNYEKYINVMENIRERCLKMSTAFEAATPLEVPEQARASRFESTQPESLAATATNCMKSLYENMGCVDQFEQVDHFLKNGPLRASTFYLDHDLDQKAPAQDFSAMLNEFDRLDHFIFEFVPFTELGEQRDQKKEPKIEAQAIKDKALFSDLQVLGSSYRYIYCDQIRSHTYKEQKVAYKLSAHHFEGLTQIEDNDTYEEQFKGQRDRTFSAAARVLFAINKRGFLNGFSLKYLSMPVEYSLQHNYWAYQVIKMYLVEQQKAKMRVDIGGIAHLSRLHLGQAVDPNINKSLPASQTIRVSKTEKPGAFALKTALTNQSAEPVPPRRNSSFEQLLSLLSNTESPDHRYKLSLLSCSAHQLEHQEHICRHQVAILEEIRALARGSENVMRRVHAHIGQRLTHFNDHRALQGLYDAFERSYIEQNKITNQRSIEQILTGAGKYLGMLKAAIVKELEEQEGEVAAAVEPLLAQLEKLARDARNVQDGLSLKAKQLQDELAKKSHEQLMMTGGQTSRRSRSPAASQSSKAASKQSPMKMVALHADMTKELESKIVAQVIQALTYQDVLIAARHHQDGAEFVDHIASKVRAINVRLARITRMRRYCLAVSGAQDGQKSGQDPEDVVARYHSKGAKLMHAVLSGNMGNKIDIYKLNRLIDPRSSHAGTHDRLDETGVGPLSDAGPTVSNDDKLEMTPHRDPGMRESQQSSMKSLHTDIEGVGSPAHGFSPTQEGLNYLVNFLNQICDQEDCLSSNRVLKHCPLFQLGHTTQVDFFQMKSEHLQRCNEEQAATYLLNVHEIQQTTVQKYLESYEKHAIFVKRELFSMSIKSDQNLLTSQFYEILSKKSQSLVKSVINKVDDVFCEAVLDDDEKTEFGNAQTKVRRSLDLEMRVFCEFLDTEANKRLTEVHESSQKQHEIKLVHSLTALKLLVRIYYLKQIQTQENFMHNLQLEQQQASARLD